MEVERVTGTQKGEVGGWFDDINGDFVLEKGEIIGNYWKIKENKEKLKKNKKIKKNKKKLKKIKKIKKIKKYRKNTGKIKKYRKNKLICTVW